jgi:hypothetical protein
MANVLDFFRQKQITTLSTVNLSPRALYERLDLYYFNNDLYNSIEYASAYNNLWIESMKGLRTSVHRSVEFYTSHVATKITVTADNDTVKQAIEQFHKWSNFETTKRLAIRQFSLYGDVFYKVVNTPDKVYFESINPKCVKDFDEDSRGNITEIRIETVVEVDEHDMINTEYWNKDDGYCSIWTHDMGYNADLSSLGTPDEYYSLIEFGVDFIPIVHSKFVDVGKKRGNSCVAHALMKIDDANRMATRLEQILFRYNKRTWAIMANASDANGRPIPAPKLANSNTGLSNDTNALDEDVFYLPGTSSMASMIPNINYDSALNILKAMETEIEQDLPELKYYSLADSHLSGKAIRSLLAGAIDRGKEAQDNFLDAIKKLDEMALTIGIFNGIFPASLGNYANGDFEHNIDGGEMFGIDVDEKAASLKLLTDAGLALESAMKILGFSEEDITQAVESKSKQDAITQNNFLSKFNAGA